MKKLILSVIVIVGLIIQLNAQETKDLGMSAGDITLEVNFRPANDFPIQMNNIKGRYFLDGRTAVRMGFVFNIISDTDEVGNTEFLDRVVNFGLFPGIEMHFPVSDRVSPYFGGELGYRTRTTTNREKDDNIDIITKNANGISVLSLHAIAGMDFHVYKGLYMGLELGYGFNRQSFKDTENTTNGTTTINENNEKIFMLNDNVNAAIRLGWSFSF